MNGKRRRTRSTQLENEHRKRQLYEGRRCTEKEIVTHGRRVTIQLCGRLLPCPLHGGKRQRR